MKFPRERDAITGSIIYAKRVCIYSQWFTCRRKKLFQFSQFFQFFSNKIFSFLPLPHFSSQILRNYLYLSDIKMILSFQKGKVGTRERIKQPVRKTGY